MFIVIVYVLLWGKETLIKNGLNKIKVCLAVGVWTVKSKLGAIKLIR